MSRGLLPRQGYLENCPWLSYTAARNQLLASSLHTAIAPACYAASFSAFAQ